MTSSDTRPHPVRPAVIRRFAVLVAAVIIATTASMIARAQPGDSKSQAKGDRAVSTRKSRDRARQAIRSGDVALAESLIDKGLTAKSQSRRNPWRILLAELRYAQGRYADAGLAAMRVAILSPKSVEASVGLYWAARVYEKLERPDKAASLYHECANHERVPKSIRRAAESRLKELDSNKEG